MARRATKPPQQGRNVARFPTLWKSLAAITDGTSNTLVFSERCTNPGTAIYNSIRGGILRTNVNTTYRLQNPQTHCMIYRGSNNMYGNIGSFEVNGNRSGLRFLDNAMCMTWFNTAIPPNGPTCSYIANDSIPIEPGFYPPTSYHTGGVNACSFDGSTKFVSDTIDTGTLNTIRPKGMEQSPYGVWGAVGTINCGESKSL